MVFIPFAHRSPNATNIYSILFSRETKSIGVVDFGYFPHSKLRGEQLMHDVYILHIYENNQMYIVTDLFLINSLDLNYV